MAAAAGRWGHGYRVTRDALFDIGADTVGLLVPGGGIAVKVARLAIDQRRKT
jgi:hypothetical protein